MIYFDEGTYQAKITTWGLSKAKTGTNQFFICFKPTGQIVEDGDGRGIIPCSDHERTIFRPITENTINYVIDDLQQLGYNRDGFQYLDPAAQNAHNFAGQDIEVVCAHESYQGKDKERWSFGWAGGGSLQLKPLENDDVRKLNALFGKRLMSAKTAAASKANGATPNQAPARPASPAPARQPVRQPAHQQDDGNMVPLDESIPF